MLFFTPKMTQKDKIDFLEYLSFQLKAKSSFEKATARYISGVKRKEIVKENCNFVIELIRNGNSPAVALYEGGFLNEQEYSLVLNSINSSTLDASIRLIVDLKKDTIKSSDILKRSINTGLLVFMGIMSLIPLFRDYIIQMYQMFADMASMASSEKQPLQLPFIVEHWWSIYVIFGAIMLIYASIKYFLLWLYNNKGDIYYRVFKYKMYMDLITILEVLRQMTSTMSMNNAYRALSQTAPTQYWRDFFMEIDLTLKNGGKASDVFAANGAIPVDVVYAIVDAQETGEVDGYLKKAVEFCFEKNNNFQDNIRVGVPMFFELSLFLIIGLVVIKFMNDMNNLGIMNVIAQVAK